MSELKTCENFGCGQKYCEADNDGQTSVCVHHSGEPFFHDAYKGWTCCQQKSTDFQTFLNFKGCKRGMHSDVKRETPLKPQKEHKVETPLDDDEEETSLPVDESLWTEIRIEENKTLNDSKVEVESKRVFCRKCGQSDDSGRCVFHSGQVIFHDSLKYWTCCDKKKFTDFEDFQSLKGCESAESHEMAVRVTKPREDFFETNETIHYLLYGLKGVRSLRSKVETNSRVLRLELRDAQGLELFALERRLQELVSGSESRVLVSSSKVEIVLSKVRRKKFWKQMFE